MGPAIDLWPQPAAALDCNYYHLLSYSPPSVLAGRAEIPRRLSIKVLDKTGLEWTESKIPHDWSAKE